MCLFEDADLLVSDLELPILVVAVLVILEFLIVFASAAATGSHAPAVLLTDIALIRQYHHANVWPTVFLNFLQPTRDVLEGLPVGEVEDDHDAVGVFVVGLGDGAVALLTSRVPDLQANRAFIDL